MHAGSTSSTGAVRTTEGAAAFLCGMSGGVGVEGIVPQPRLGAASSGNQQRWCRGGGRSMTEAPLGNSRTWTRGGGVGAAQLQV